MKKKDEKYENKKREKKEKKELKQKQANEQLKEEINFTKYLILKDCEKEFDNIELFHKILINITNNHLPPIARITRRARRPDTLLSISTTANLDASLLINIKGNFAIVKTRVIGLTLPIEFSKVAVKASLTDSNKSESTRSSPSLSCILDITSSAGVSSSI